MKANSVVEYMVESSATAEAHGHVASAAATATAAR